MLEVGGTTEFERSYVAKFKAIAESHGIFVEYEADRAARDVGLHLTKKTKSGALVMNSVVWFQMKGQMTGTLSANDFSKNDFVKVPLEVKHLRHWFLDDTPTHLLVYVESVDKFLVMNLQTYIAEKWGAKILELKQLTATVSVPTSSVLDAQAFSLLLRTASTSQWMKAIKLNADDALLIHRDAEPILMISSGPRRGVIFGAYWRSWQSKLRHELYLMERTPDVRSKADEGWVRIHQHWQLGGIDPQSSYPYLEFYALGADEHDDDWWDDGPEDGVPYKLENGNRVYGEEMGGEYIEYWFGVRLNAYGQELTKHINALIKLGLLEQGSSAKGINSVDIAPWHHRSV